MLDCTTTSLSSILSEAASHHTGGVRSFPTSKDETIWLKYAYDAPDRAYAKLWFRHVDGHRGTQSDAAATPAAGWVIPDDSGDCHPVFVAHSLLAAIWLLREMLPAALSQTGWLDLVDAAQSLSYRDGSPSPPPSTQRPAAAQMEDLDLDLDLDAESEPDSVQSRKRQDPLASIERAHKRVCTPVSPAPSDESSLSHSPHHIITVTNENRRSDMRIQKNIAKAHERRKLDLGLHPPAKNASRAETQAYSSVSPTDVQHISWLFKQPMSDNNDLFQTASSPYKTASDMLAKARMVGHQETWLNAASFLSSWRRYGTPFHAQEPTAPSQRRSWARASSTPADSAVFHYAWKMCDYYETQLASAIIQYRWAMALLGRVHANKIAQLKENDRVTSSNRSRNRYGRGQVRTEAVDGLLRTVTSETPSRAQRLAFRQRLLRASRWYSAVMALGWGSLCLMPPDAISNKWAEKTLTRPEWDVWLQLIKKVEPDVCTASRKLDAWLGTEGIEGGPIQDKKPLCIESGSTASVGGVEEEVADSDVDSDSGVDSDGEEAATGSPCRPLRQLTLLELFVPKG